MATTDLGEALIYVSIGGSLPNIVQNPATNWNFDLSINETPLSFKENSEGAQDNADIITER